MVVAYRFGRFELNPATRQLLVDGEPAALGTRAFEVLSALLERRERLVTKDELLDLAWPGLVVEENNLQVQVSSLRKIMGDGIIQTLRGKGYRFTAEATPFEPSNSSPATRRHNLPQPLTRFIGHESDLEEYEKIVIASRLATLIGVGGCGKTRLAIELTSRLLPKFADGVWFVDLAPIADAERLPLTVARTFGLTEDPGQPIVELLCEHLAERQMLLVLDNCEQLIDACATLVATMLDRAGQVHVLATSREALGVPGERILRVRPLSFPPPDQQCEVGQLGAFEAVQLFVDRARLVQPEFALDEGGAPAVADICRRLDGIPLAIELAAARTKVCSASELRKMLDDRFQLLVGGSKLVSPRQQTLHATVTWSFDLLTTDERRLLKRLSFFSGGWTLDAAVAIAGEEANKYEVLDRLARLVDKSLISARTHAETTRYSMLETVRQYASEELIADGAETATVKRHLEYFVVLAERLEQAITAENKEAMQQLAPELENIVQALQWCGRVPGGAGLGLRLVATLGQYWMALGLLELGHRLTTEPLSRRDDDAPSLARARALLVATRIAGFLGRREEARDHANECLRLARLLRDDHIAAGALAYLGMACMELGNATQGIAFVEQSLDLARKSADAEQTARALCALGSIHCELENLESAPPFFEEALQIARDEGHFHAVVMAAASLAWTYLSLGQLERVWPLLVEALDLSLAAKAKFTMESPLGVVVKLLAAARDWPAAARMLGAADAARKLVGHKQAYPDRETTAARIRNSLPKVNFDAAYTAGYSLTLEKAIGEARVWVEKSARTAPSIVLEFRRQKPPVFGH